MEYLIKNFLPSNALNLEDSVTATIFGAILFSLTLIYLVEPMIEKLEIDKKFYLSTIPWLVSAGGLSALHGTEDTEPLINGFIFAALLATLLIAIYAGKIVERKQKLDKSYSVFLTGIVTSMLVVVSIDFSNTIILYETAAHIISWLVPLTILFYVFRNENLQFEMFAPVVTHFMDASSTVISISNGAVEKQIIASLFIEAIGPHGIFMLKAIVIIPVVYYIDKNTDEKKRIFYLYSIASLGLVITLRNTFLAVSGL